MTTDLIPIPGAWVSRRGTNPLQIGNVIANSTTNGEPTVEVDFGPAGKARLNSYEWGCGLQVGFCVQDVPLSGVRETMGSGTVLHIRELATRFQALVQFHATGQSVWLPFERLRRIMSPALLYRRAGPLAENSAERLSLNVVGHALSKWNEATGALDRLDVDPLPHQISLVHRVLNSGQTNWLIADDVGLGKTIEVGLLLAALERRQNVRRILLVVPSGLTRQWKEEMQLKFDRTFRIYGTDFRVPDYREWGLYERVIVSLDLIKPRDADDDGSSDETNFGMLLAAGNWDVIIFDEAHRLARDERGRSTLRFKLAQALRQKTDALLLLSGTPHQGDQGKFRNLLALVRPDLRAQIDVIDAEPDVVQEIVLRNRKIDAMDLNGDFLFKGLLVRRVSIETDPEVAFLENKLQEYLKRGYQAGDVLGGAQGRAIGFVMTIYRKLASSSVTALWFALQNRLKRLSEQASSDSAGYLNEDENEDEDTLQDRTASSSPFFADETRLLRELIDRAKQCLTRDRKGDALVDLIKELVVKENKKVLIFTEYRATQLYLVAKIENLLGERPQVINGGQTVDEKRDAVRAFEESAQVLISTEAGAEGLNLHRNCHVLVNYDLPWNPARLSQRIGRLYRYGQKHRVIVVNFQARDTIDNEIVSILLDRLDTIVREMASVGPEFNELYAADVMGELLERVDISSLLEEARDGRVERTQERIDAALEEARRAKLIQDDILSFAGAGASADFATFGSFSTSDLSLFIKRAAKFFDIIVEGGRDAERFTLRLPSDLKGKFNEFGGRSIVEATTKRIDWRPDREVLLDFSTSFVNWLVKRVTAEDFGGAYAAMRGDLDQQFFAVFLARFQNDQGHIQGEKLIIIENAEAGGYSVNPRIVRSLLTNVGRETEPKSASPEERAKQFEAARDRAEVAMAEELTRFKHPNDLVTIAVGEVSFGAGQTSVLSS